MVTVKQRCGINIVEKNTFCVDTTIELKQLAVWVLAYI